MEHLKYTTEHLSEIVREVDRRVELAVNDGYVVRSNAKEFRDIMVQGVYSVLMATSSNKDWRALVGKLEEMGL